MDHETAHALYYTDSDYKREADAVLATLDLSPIRRWLSSSGGYHHSVFDDETQAYLISNPAKVCEAAGADINHYREGIERLRALYLQRIGRDPVSDDSEQSSPPQTPR